MSELALPEGWSYQALDTFLDFALGGDWGKSADYEDPDYVTVYCIRGTEISHWSDKKGSTAVERKIKFSSLQKRKLKVGDILVEISGGGPDQPVGRTVVIDEKVLRNFDSDNVVCTNFLRLFRPIEEVDSKYLNYYLQMFYNSGYINEYQSGSNNLRNLKFKEFLTINIPYASLLEQKQIVLELERYFQIVSQIQARLEAIPKLIEKFRQSVLNDAVSGKLSNVEFKNIEQFKICDIAQVNPKKEKHNDDLEVSFSSMSMMSADFDKPLEFENKKWIEVKKGYTSFINDDVLLAKITPCFENGKSVIAKGLTNGIGTGSTEFLVVRCTNKVLPDWILYHFKQTSFISLGVANMSGSVGHRRVPKEFIEDYKVYLPSVDKQVEIISRIKQLFTHADQIEKSVAAAKARVDNLTQSILHQAFTGNLTADWRAQNPDLINGENSAEALLARIKAEKQAKKAVKKK